MMLFQGLLLGALAGSAFAAPALLDTRATTWTLESFTRTCNDSINACVYSYKVNENDGNPSQACTYTITGTNTTSARHTDYTQVPCTETSRFAINQGYAADTDSFVLVPTDKSLSPNVYAFFGYTEAELQDGVAVSPDHQEPAVPVGTFPPKEKRATSPGWTVQNVTRNCNPVCVYYLAINENVVSHGATYCQVLTSTYSNGSFYAVPCQQTTPYRISWGYNSAADSAVMTVVNLDENSDAFFGFDGVNSKGGAYGNVGPNLVYSIN